MRQRIRDDPSHDVQKYASIANASWVLHSALCPQSRVLLFDDMLTGGVLPLAYIAGSVCVVAASGDDARRVKAFLRGTGNRTVSIVAGSSQDLPFCPGSFDGIVIPPPDRCMTHFGSLNKMRRALGEMTRLLSCAGKIYLINRKASVAINPQSPPVVIPGRGLRAIFHDSGLRVLSLVSFYPDPDFPLQVQRIQLPPKSIQDLDQLLRFVFLRKGYLLVLSRPGRRSASMTAAIDGILHLLGQRSTARQRTEHFHVGSADTFVAVTSDYVVRIPLSLHGRARCKNNSLALRALASKRFPFQTPEIAHELGENGIEAFVESRLDGREPGYNQVNPAITSQAIGHLAALHERTAVMVHFSHTHFSELLCGPIQELRSALGFTREGARIVSVLDGIENSLRHDFIGKSLSLVFMHGDFKISNLLVTRNSVSGIIDWDLAHPHAFPVVDLLLFKAYNGFIRTGAICSVQLAGDVSRREFLGDPADKEYLCRVPGINRVLVPGLYMVTLIYYFSRLLKGSPLFHHGAWVADNVVSPITVMNEYLYTR